MPLSRRFFLQSCSWATVSAIATKAGVTGFAKRVPKHEYYEVPIRTQGEFLYITSYDSFQPYINSIFTSYGAHGDEVQLTLVSVTKYEPNPNTGITTAKTSKTKSFSLSFSATGKLPGESIIPTLSHPALGDLRMFLSYKGEENTGYRYEAVINHI